MGHKPAARVNCQFAGTRAWRRRAASIRRGCLAGKPETREYQIRMVTPPVPAVIGQCRSD